MSDLLTMGRGLAAVVGVIAKDRDGKPLELTNGGTYRKLKLSVTDANGKGGYIYDPIWGGDKEKIASIVDAIGDEYLKERFKKGLLQDGELFGYEFEVMIGVKKPKPGSGYDAQNIIDCYRKKRALTATQVLLNGSTPEYVPQQRPVGGMSEPNVYDDYVPDF